MRHVALIASVLVVLPFVLAQSQSTQVKLPVAARSLFPRAPFSQIASGSETRLLIGVENLGHENATIYQLVGSWQYVQVEKVFRNMTPVKVNVEVGPGDSVTLGYNVKPEMEAQDLKLIVFVDYTDESQKNAYRVVGFNQTIHITEPIVWFDSQILVVYVLLAAAAYFAFGVVRNAFFKSTSLASPPVAKKPVSSRKDDAAVNENSKSQEELISDWLPDHIKSGKDLKQRRKK